MLRGGWASLWSFVSLAMALVMSSETVSQNEVMYLKGIPNYNLDKSFDFYFTLSDTQNHTYLLFKIIDFCIRSEIYPSTYKNMFDQVLEIANREHNTTIETFTMLNTTIKDGAIDALHQKYRYPFTDNPSKSIRSSTYWSSFCGLSQANAHHSVISQHGDIENLRTLFPRIVGLLNSEFQENRYQVADEYPVIPKETIPEYWTNMLAEALTRTVMSGADHNWVDESICLRIMLNRTFDSSLEPMVDTSKKIQSKACSGSLESYTYSPLSYFFSLRLQTNYKLRYVGDYLSGTENTLSSGGSEANVLNNSIDGADSNSQISGKSKPLVAFSAYEYYIVENLTHLFDAFELTWSFLAFMQKERMHLSSTIEAYQYAIVIPLDDVLHSIRESGLQRFVHLMFSTLIRVSSELDIQVFVKNVSHVSEFLLENDFNSTITPTYLSVLKSYENVVFPVLMERAVINALTHEGAAAMTRELVTQCGLMSQSNKSQSLLCETAATNGNDQTCQNQGITSISTQDDSGDNEMPYRIVLAARRGNRFISNLDEVVKTIESVFVGHKVDVVYFGDLSPCEQIAVARSASVFIFVHGAEGRMISLMRPGTLAVELWPGCKTSHDFYMMYKFFFPSIADAAQVRHAYFSATYASTTVCQAWEYRMRIAHGCGMTVVASLFKSFLKKILPLEKSRM